MTPKQTSKFHILHYFKRETVHAPLKSADFRAHQRVCRVNLNQIAFISGMINSVATTRFAYIELSNGTILYIRSKEYHDLLLEIS